MRQVQLQKTTDRLNALLCADDAQEVQIFLRGGLVKVVGVDWTEATMQLIAYVINWEYQCVILLLSPSESDQICGAIVSQA